jgi:hypothetical protein
VIKKFAFLAFGRKMKLISTLLFAITALNAAPMILPPRSKSGDIIPDHYIIVFKETVSPSDISKHWNWLHGKISPPLNVQGNGNSWLDSFDVLFTYEVNNFKAYAAKLPKFM